MIVFCKTRPNAGATFVLALLLSTVVPFMAACDRSGQATAAQPMAGGGPVAVSMTVLEPKPVDRTSEYMATVRSRRTTDVRPQVEGIVTRIFVKSGDRVAAGRPIAQVDPHKQEATLSGNEASRAAQQAQLQLSREELKRQQALFDQGLVSRQVLDQARAAVDTAAASLRSMEAHEQESRVELQVLTVSPHRPRASSVTSPCAWAIG